jgi:YfiH family protein
MKINIKDNLFLKVNDLPENILSISTTNKCNVFDIFDSLDNKRKICINKEFFKKHFNVEHILLPHQVHSNNVLYMDDVDCSFLECDGLITDKKNVALGILTADCYAVQFYGKHLIANIHCGWRGIYGGIIENTINIFKKFNDVILGAIVGIGICEKCYIVGVDLIEKFNERFESLPYFKDNLGFYHLSLRQLIINVLKENNVYSIYELNYCSSCNDFLYSYRRNNKTNKRLLSLIIRK